jgi:hypothetical protein
MLLRLREIRLPNVPFFNFPSYANVSRYEHSIAVAHLAWWWARRNDLSRTDAEALALAGLYHDAATPAFSHLYEEQLAERGFDHEGELARMIGAHGSIPGGRFAQVFLGREPALRRELEKRSDKLTPTRLFQIMRGTDPLGTVIHGDLDLDNIDNVLRAATAMGVIDRETPHPYDVAAALTLESGRLALAESGMAAVQGWRRARHTVYGSILSSEKEFLAQTAVKWAIELCAQDDSHRVLREPEAWTITEPEMIFDHLRQVPESRVLIDDLRRGRVPTLLASARLSDISGLTSGQQLRNVRSLASAALRADCFVNFYADKRARRIHLPRAQDGRLVAVVHEEGGVEVSNAKAPGIVGLAARGGRARGVLRESPEYVTDTFRHVLSEAVGAPLDVTTSWQLDVVVPEPLQEQLL